MTNISNSFSKLCRSYVKLADRFQQLDVECMTLKGKIVPILKQLKAYQDTIEALKHEKTALRAELDSVTAKYEELKIFEELLSPEMQSLLQDAQDQVDLVDETLTEMDEDNDPDLSDDDKEILQAFKDNPDAFALPDLGALLNGSGSNGHTPNGSSASGYVGHYETASF